MQRMQKIFIVTLAAIGLASCRTTNDQFNSDSSEILAADSSAPCSKEQAALDAVKAELAKAEAFVAANPDNQGQKACSEKAGATWNNEIGRCECLTDKTKFSGNAWSIKNTLQCEVNTQGFDACKEIAGAMWNGQIGRCECKTDNTKFSANAWSIRNTLKCEANVSGFDACKAKEGAEWNNQIGRCECTLDRSRFSANAWSIANTLQCPVTKSLPKFNNSGFALNMPTTASPTDKVYTKVEVDALKMQVADLEMALQVCKKAATPATTVVNKCSCSWDRTGRYCAVFRDLRAVGAYFGPMPQNSGWQCVGNARINNNLCSSEMLRSTLDSAACKN